MGEVWDDIFGITDAGTFDFGDCIPLDKAFSFEFLLGVLTFAVGFSNFLILL